MEEVTAKHVKALYVRRRRLQHPKYTPAPRWDTCWQKIADKVNALGCDPADYIESQFLYRHPFPHPNTMYSQRATDIYEVYTTEHKSGGMAEEFKKAFEGMTGLLESRIKLGFTAEEILTSETQAFTPLFRVALAKFFALDPSTMKNFEEAAWREYEAHPALKKIYSEYMEASGD